MQWAIYALVAALIAGAGVAVVHTYNRAITQAERSDADLKIERANNSTLTNSLADQKIETAKQVARADAMAEVAKRRVAANVKMDDIERTINAKFAALAAQSPEVRNWLATRVPDAIVAGLREPEATSAAAGTVNSGVSQGSAAGKPDSANGGAGMAVSNDKRRAFGTSPPVSPPAAGVQRR